MEFNTQDRLNQGTGLTGGKRVRKPGTSMWEKYNVRLLVGIFTLAAAAQSGAQFSFTPGDYYSSTTGSPVITQYTPTGAATGSLTVPGTGSVRGMMFGPDGLLYATTDQGSGFSVFAMNSAGTVKQTYSSPVYVEGNLTYGQLAVDSQHLYVTGQNQLTAFSIGQPNSGTVIYQNNQIFGVTLTPGGNLFVASAYQIQEITPAGSVLATVPGYFVDLRGIAYDAALNSLFVTELGYTGNEFQLLRLDATTGAVEASTSFWYGANVSLTQTGDLLVGSWTQPAGIFDENLRQIGTLNNGAQLFVTVDAVPEPSTALLMGSAGLLLAVRKLAFCRNKARKRLVNGSVLDIDI